MKHLLSKITSFFIISVFSFLPVIGFAQITNNTLDTGTQQQGTNIINGSNLNSGSNIGVENLNSNIISSPLTINDSQGRYRPITPQFQQIFGNTGGSFEGMLQRIFEITIYFTVILSVIMMIIGGVEYMGSESVFKKSDGKGRIFAALAGLLIALVSILVISTILPGGSGNMFRITIFN